LHNKVSFLWWFHVARTGDISLLVQGHNDGSALYKFSKGAINSSTMVGHPALPKLLGVNNYDQKCTNSDPYYGYNSDKMQHLIATSKSEDTLDMQYKAVGGPNGLFTDIQR
jgi:hypothetical protein